MTRSIVEAAAERRAVSAERRAEKAEARAERAELLLRQLSRQCEVHRPTIGRSWCFSCVEWCSDGDDLVMKCTGCAIRLFVEALPAPPRRKPLNV